MNAIEVENLSKQYRLGTIGTGTLWKDVNIWWASIRGKENPYAIVDQINDRTQKASGDFVWALKDINFKIQEGDIVGIIGKNGAGKSTLLKILSRITTPTTGRITTYGRIASLLEVGTGFHQEMTGRENVYMNGAVLGMTKAEINNKLDEIVHFAGVEKYIDTPVKRYSSGMIVRLGFAVAAHLEPDILIVDEVLAVGDAEFQKKAIGKMREVSRGEGRTVLFVSHNMSAVRNLCKNGIVLKNGMIDYVGTASDCIDRFLEASTIEIARSVNVDSRYRLAPSAMEIEIRNVTLHNNPVGIATNETIRLSVDLIRHNPNINNARIYVGFRNREGERVVYYASILQSLPLDANVFSADIEISNHGLVAGNYSLDVEVGICDFYSTKKMFDSVFSVLSFDVVYVDFEKKTIYNAENRYWGHIIHNEENIRAIIKDKNESGI